MFMSLEGGWRALFDFVVGNALPVAVTTLAVWVTYYLLRDRAAARWLLVLWLVPIAKMVAPVSIATPLSASNAVAPYWIDRTPRPSAGKPLQRTSLVWGRETPTAPENAAMAVGRTPAAWHLPKLMDLLYYAWTLVVAVLLARLAALHFLFVGSILKRRPVLRQEILETLQECKEELGLNVPIDIFESDSARSPALLGFFRPRLLLPERMTQTFTLEELRMVFLHELTHLRRHDIVMCYVLKILDILYFFNPFTWLASRCFRAEMECACDELTLAGERGKYALPYGRVIVKLLEGYSENRLIPGTAGILEGPKSILKRRLTMIARDDRGGSPRWTGITLAMTLILGVAFLTQAKDDSAPGQANYWDNYKAWEASRRSDEKKAAELLPGLIKNVYLVTFQPVNGFDPKNPGEFLTEFGRTSGLLSGKDRLGGASFFRTKVMGEHLIGSFLTEEPEQMKADIKKNPSLRFMFSMELTPKIFVEYVDSPQESLPAPKAAAPPDTKVASSTDQRAGETTLKHGDDTVSGVRSYGGEAGPVVLFTTPNPDGGELLGLRLKGSRYGYPEVPDENITIYITDRACAKVIAKRELPYSAFAGRVGTEPKKQYAVRVDFLERVRVPHEFNVYLHANAHQTKGIYWAIGGGEAATANSRLGEGLPPKTELTGIGKGGWMVEAVLADTSAAK